MSAILPTGITARPQAEYTIRSSFKVIVVLPVYNEELNIGPLLERLREHLNDSLIPYEIVAVNDGSSDRSLEILEDYATREPIHVLRHVVNQGLGNTLRDGTRLNSSHLVI